MISLILPVYNGEKTISKTIKSILNQSYQNFELIIINDGSTDNTKGNCLAFKDERIKFFDTTNKGVSAARNRGLIEAKGDYIQFIDADDYIDVETLSKLKTAIKDYDLSMCSFVTHYKDRVFKGKLKTFEGDVNYIWENYLLLYQGAHIQYVWNKLYIRKIIENSNIKFQENVKLGEDTLFNLEYFEKIKSCSFISDRLYNYNNNNEESITQSYISNMFLKYKYVFKAIKIKLIKNDCFEHNKKNFYKVFFLRTIKSIDNLFHDNCEMNTRERITNLKEILKDDLLIQTLNNFEYRGVKERMIFSLMKRNNFKTLYLLFHFKNI